MNSKKTKKEQNHKQESVAVIQKGDGNWKYLVFLSIALTIIAFLPVFNADFVNWDDQDYVMNNKLIRSLAPFSKFFTEPVQGNFHPLTMISLAINYAISGENAMSYHALNLLIHVLNVLLVFKLISRLLPNQIVVSFGVSLLFGVHPMHVESVAWVSERKDVLYSFFFFLGFLRYLKFTESGEKKYLVHTFLFFLLSILSKPAAIIFPVVLFAFDFYKQRKYSLSLIAEKIPFFIVSALFVYLTLQGQSTAGATDVFSQFGIDKRIFFPFYGSMMYLYKLILPIHLTPFYPFPAINNELAMEYKLSPILFGSIFWLCWKTWRKHREITFGFAFFYINLALVLQFFIVGSAIIAERYTYMPYVGIFFIIAWFLNNYLKISERNSTLLFGFAGLLFTIMSFNQSAKWKNTESLWDGAIKSHPGARVYANRAYIHQQKGEWGKALDYYTKSLKYNVIDPEVYTNMGVIYYEQNKDSLAMVNYQKALELRPNFINALNGRGSLLARQGKNELAIADFNRSIELKPKYELAYKNRGSAYFILKNFEAAIKDYISYTELMPQDYEGYSNLGVVYMSAGKNEEAIIACEKSINLKDNFAKAYSNMGAAYINLKQYDKAIQHLEKSVTLDSSNEESMKFLSLAYISKGDTAKAMSVFNRAQRMFK